MAEEERPGIESAGSKAPCSVEYIHGDNHFSKPLGGVDKLVVWGGCVANCGESELARIVAENASRLRSVLYCPDRTKGGCLIRPGYHRGDRGLKMEFPELVDLAIRLSPPLAPESYGWITPKLRRLRLLCPITALQRSRDGGNRGTPDWKLPDSSALRHWLDVNKPNALPRVCLRSCPSLESITIALCSTAELDCAEVDWIEMLPPKHLPWSIYRLLLLAVMKPAQQHDAVVKAQASPLSFLSTGLMNTVIAFLHRPSWEYREKTLPTPFIEKFSLPDEMCNLRCKQILDGADFKNGS